MKNLAIFASGNGTNTENIIKFFLPSNTAKVELILTENPTAGVIHRAKKLNTKVIVFDKNELRNSDKILNLLIDNKIDFIILAGFLKLIPAHIIKHYPNKIINIHPALLPKYGGKGMYGMNVHNAVIKNKEKTSGITIHYVNEKYDDGQIIFQAECKVEKTDTPESLAQKIHKLEYEHYPKIINQIISK